MDINDLSNYNPYEDLAEFRDSDYFEQKFLEYFEEYRGKIEQIKESSSDSGNDIDESFVEMVRLRNNQEIERIFHEYPLGFSTRNVSDNEAAVVKLKQDIRMVKDIILAVEPVDMERLQVIDDRVWQLIDKVSMLLGVSDNVMFDGIRLDQLMEWFCPNEYMNLDEYTDYALEFKKLVDEACEHYRKNYSIETATKNINDIIDKMNKILDRYAIELGILEEDQKFLRDWITLYEWKEYQWEEFSVSNYEKWLTCFNEELDKLRVNVKARYSTKMAKKMGVLIDKNSGELIDQYAVKVGYPSIHEKRLKEIFDTYNPSELNMFLEMYSDEEERRLVVDKYNKMTSEQKNVFMMRLYDGYIRKFKSKIHGFNKEIRRVYSSRYANKMVDSVNKRADQLIQEKARLVGKPVPKNPWFIRKYLWADTENFATENGVKFRKFINPFMSNLVRVAMNNKLIIEERPQLDPMKGYVFVPTHYFTEDIIGLYASLGRQSYVLMGTTDQIENNLLMLAATILGLFYVDREDTVSRRECVDKQNRLIDYGSNVTNYVGGSWENSENELQPLSFSGPYRTSNAKNVEIVPVGLYLVREEKKIYVRYGDPLDLSKCDEVTANEIIRDTLASIHFKQMVKHSVPIETIEIDGYGKTHNLPYNQHIHYMEQVAKEYWNQYWSRPFAKEEIGVRPKKTTDEEAVYSFVDNLSRERLMELSRYLSEPMLRRYEREERYNIVKYIDENYERLKRENSGVKSRRKVKKGN